MSHWLSLNRYCPRIELRRGVFTAVSADLAAAVAEADWLGWHVAAAFGLAHHSLAVRLWDRVRAELADAPPDPDFDAHLGRVCQDNPDGWASDTLARILAEADHEVQHFACHGKFSDRTELLSRLVFRLAAAARVWVNVGDFDAAAAAADDAPGRLVFLNACSSGKPAGLTPPGQPDLWIRHRGAQAVVATLCPVPDAFAAAFARHFYERLFAGAATVADAFLAARRHFLDEHHNPLGLAYVLYAYPGAHLDTGAGP